MGVKFRSNFNEVTKHIGKAAESINGAITIEDLFNDSFVNDNTNFDSVEAFLNELPVEVKQELSDEEVARLDGFVEEHTNFKDWKELFESAVQTYAMNKLKSELGF